MQLTLYTELRSLYSEMLAKFAYALCGPNVEFLNVKPAGTYSSHWALEVENYVFIRQLKT